MTAPSARFTARGPVNDVDYGERVARAGTEDEKVELTARWILDQFEIGRAHV